MWQFMIQQAGSYKLFFIKLGIFLFSLLLADIALGTLLKKAYHHQHSGYDYYSTLAIDSTTAPILIFGSSRAVNIFDPAILTAQLGQNSFNAGRVGQSVFYHYAVLKAATKRYKPQVVVLSVDAADFAFDKNDYDKIAQLLPYYKQHPEMAEVVKLRGSFEAIKMLSHIYPYNSMILPILKGHLTNNADGLNNGFGAIHKTMQGPPHPIDYSAFNAIDTLKVAVFSQFINTCINQKVALFVVCPPYRVTARGTDTTLQIIQAIAEEKKVPFLNYAFAANYTSHQDYFADFRHLNKQGSAIFTNEVAQIIKASKTME
jgi:hypothetical protein